MTPAQTARMIWLAMLLAVALDLIVLIAVIGRGGGAGAMPVDALRHVFGALALAQAAAIVVLRGRTGGDLARAVIPWALAEAIAVYGLVLGLLARDVGEGRPFLVVAVALLLWLRPRPA